MTVKLTMKMTCGLGMVLVMLLDLRLRSMKSPLQDTCVKTRTRLTLVEESRSDRLQTGEIGSGAKVAVVDGHSVSIWRRSRGLSGARVEEEGGGPRWRSWWCVVGVIV